MLLFDHIMICAKLLYSELQFVICLQGICLVYICTGMFHPPNYTGIYKVVITKAVHNVVVSSRAVG